MVGPLEALVQMAAYGMINRRRLMWVGVFMEGRMRYGILTAWDVVVQIVEELDVDW